MMIVKHPEGFRFPDKIDQIEASLAPSVQRHEQVVKKMDRQGGEVEDKMKWLELQVDPYFV